MYAMKFVVLILLYTYSATAIPKNQTGGRIVGGSYARAGQFKYAAGIYTTTSNGNYFCGGSLISNQWILTVGHCVDGVLLFNIILGTTNLQNEDENSERVATDTYILHPDFNPNTLENDVGLIGLRMPVTFTNYIDQAYLPSIPLETGHLGTVIGWGQTDDANETANYWLRYVNLVAVSDEECRATYGNQIKENLICFAGNSNEGTCIGDSGSPIVQLKFGDYMEIIGIANFMSTNGCESPDPSGFTAIYPYNDWINSAISSYPDGY